MDQSKAARLRENWRIQVAYGRPQLWYAAAFIAGAASYFCVPFMPELSWLIASAVIALLFYTILRASPSLAMVSLIVACFILGGLAGGVEEFRTAAPPLLAQKEPVPLHAEVVEIERAGDLRGRILVRVLQLKGAKIAHPFYAHLSGVKLKALAIGNVFSTEARLQPMPGPVTPGGYDPAFNAYFSGIAGTGFVAKTPVLIAPHDRALADRIEIEIAKWRRAATLRIQNVLQGETGAIAASLVTGDRSIIGQDLYASFNGSGLMHVLSISGLHMVLVAGAMFFAARLLFAALNIWVMSLPEKKMAAVAALLIATFYEIISGGAVATTRSYIMIIIVFGAVLIDRPALSIRNVVLSALLIAAFTPHEILGASFQMSFAATAALIAAHERKLFPKFKAWSKSWTVKLLAFCITLIAVTLLTSIIAEIATAPFTLHHFHRISLFGIVGNILALVFIEAAIMPGVLLTLLLLPFGAEKLALPLLGFGVDKMISVARLVSNFPHALVGVAGFGTFSLLLCSFALCWACLWRGRIALLSVVPFVAGLIVGASEPAPDLYLSRTGSSFAVRNRDGFLKIFASQRDSFEAKRWLEQDGDRRALTSVLALSEKNCDALGCAVEMKGGTVLAYSRNPLSLLEDCEKASILMTPKSAAPSCAVDKIVFDREKIAKAQGLSAMFITKPNGNAYFKIETISAQCGARGWCNSRDQ